MDFQEFTIKIDKMEWGANMNTYRHDGIACAFVLVTEKGDKGRFYKRECPLPEFNKQLEQLYLDVRETTTGVVEICHICGGRMVIDNTCKGCGYTGKPILKPIHKRRG